MFKNLYMYIVRNFKVASLIKTIGPASKKVALYYYE